MRFQPIYDIAEVCARKGLTHAVLCPGSRCAPLTLAFARHTGIQTYTIGDERSAAFVALGMSQQLNAPTVLVCTSGTAVYNFSPAVAEAFFNRVPLVILTADRPAEWVHQEDGQTIYQQNIFGHHVKRSFQLPQSYDHPDDQWMINRVINEAINLASREPSGPVHINAPFREPLYPAAGEDISFSRSVRIITDTPAHYEIKEDAGAWPLREWLAHRVLVIAGQGDFDDATIAVLTNCTEEHAIPVAGDITSNIHFLDNAVLHADVFLGQAPEQVKKSLQPDLLLTFGKSVLSKNIKLFLRQYPPALHWHIDVGGSFVDTFQHLTRTVRLSPSAFFTTLNHHLKKNETTNEQRSYARLWHVEEQRTRQVLHDFFPQEDLGEFELVSEVLKQLPDSSVLHLANSMSVRYANFIGLATRQKNIKVYCNRGTSGIDGCTSTAVGHALISDALHILVTGDMAFFYDRNAFWHNYKVPNLRVLLLNNHGGVIFKMIDGPGELPESAEYFVTRQPLTAKHLCEEYGVEYLKAGNRQQTKKAIAEFLSTDGGAKLLEIETTSDTSKKIYESFKQKIKASYEL